MNPTAYRPVIDTLNRLRPSDHFQFAAHHMADSDNRTQRAAAHHLIGKRVLVKGARISAINPGCVDLDIADPSGSMSGGCTVTVWGGDTADQWWRRRGARGDQRGPLHPDFPNY